MQVAGAMNGAAAYEGAGSASLYLEILNLPSFWVTQIQQMLNRGLAWLLLTNIHLSIMYQVA